LAAQFLNAAPTGVKKVAAPLVRFKRSSFAAP